jgi:hypothetical protein
MGYTLSAAAEDRGSRFGAGAVMLAVDELDLEGDENGSAMAFIQARPNAAHGRRSPSRSQTSMQAAEVNSLPRSVKTASTSATTRWQGELWGGSGPGSAGWGEHSEDNLLSVAVVGGADVTGRRGCGPCRRSAISSLNAVLDR